MGWIMSKVLCMNWTHVCTRSQRYTRKCHRAGCRYLDVEKYTLKFKEHKSKQKKFSIWKGCPFNLPSYEYLQSLARLSDKCLSLVQCHWVRIHIIDSSDDIIFSNASSKAIASSPNLMWWIWFNVWKWNDEKEMWVHEPKKRQNEKKNTNRRIVIQM